MGKKLTRKEKREQKLKKNIYPDIIKLHKHKERPYLFDVEMIKHKDFNKYNSIECHTVLYPYSRGIVAKDIAFYPFEEYIKDISTGQRSSYIKMTSSFHELFGIILGIIVVILAGIFLGWNEIFSIESLVSIFGAYIVGKEIWDDLEKIFIKLTRSWKIRYQESYYQYEQGKHTTLTQYSSFAKGNRYNKASILPDKIDFISHSNSKTLRMLFKRIKFVDFSDNIPIHLHSIHIKKSVLNEIDKHGFLFGIKLSFNKKFLFFTRRFELFQSISQDKKGCLDKEGNWIEDSVLYRKTISLGKIRYYRKSGIINNHSIVEITF